MGTPGSVRHHAEREGRDVDPRLWRLVYYVRFPLRQSNPRPESRGRRTSLRTGTLLKRGSDGHVTNSSTGADVAPGATSSRWGSTNTTKTTRSRRGTHRSTGPWTSGSFPPHGQVGIGGPWTLGRP